MKFFGFLAILFAFATQTSAQMTPEEVAQRMAEMNKHPSTRPAVANVPTSQPSAKPVLTLAAGAPKDVADFFDAFPAFRDERIQDCEDGLKEAKKSLGAYSKLQDASQRSEGIRDTKKRIAAINASIDGLKNGSVIFAPDLGTRRLKVGDFFSITCKAVVFQVVDDKNFILQYVDGRLPVTAEGFGVPNANMWLSGVNTTGFIDKANFDVKPDQVFRVTGTKMYTAVDGASRTIFAATEVDYKPYITASPKK